MSTATLRLDPDLEHVARQARRLSGGGGRTYLARFEAPDGQVAYGLYRDPKLSPARDCPRLWTWRVIGHYRPGGRIYHAEPGEWLDPLCTGFGRRQDEAVGGAWGP